MVRPYPPPGIHLGMAPQSTPALAIAARTFSSLPPTCWADSIVRGHVTGCGISQ
jgi:hypothetical protein